MSLRSAIVISRVHVAQLHMVFEYNISNHFNTLAQANCLVLSHLEEYHAPCPWLGRFASGATPARPSALVVLTVSRRNKIEYGYKNVKFLRQLTKTRLKTRQSHHSSSLFTNTVNDQQLLILYTNNEIFCLFTTQQITNNAFNKSVSTIDHLSIYLLSFQSNALIDNVV